MILTLAVTAPGLLHCGTFWTYHIICSPFEKVVAARHNWFDSQKLSVSFINVQTATVNRMSTLLDFPPPSCCTAVISHLFSVSHKACVGRAEHSSPYHRWGGVFPRVILIYTSVAPAHCFFDGSGVVAYGDIHPTLPSLSHFPTHLTCSSSVSRGEIWNRVGVCPMALTHSGAWITD